MSDANTIELLRRLKALEKTVERLATKEPGAGITDPTFDSLNVGTATGAAAGEIKATTAATDVAALTLSDGTHYTLQAGYLAAGVGKLHGLGGSSLSLGANNAEVIRLGSGTLSVVAALIAANGSVATAMSSVGPIGSHTTVQEWLKVTTPGGTRYIPCF